MSIEQQRVSLKLTPQEEAQRDALRATIAEEKERGLQHERFKEAIFQKLKNELIAFAKQNSVAGIESDTDTKDELWFRCKEDADWAVVSNFLDAKIATFQEMLISQEGAQLVLDIKKEPETHEYKIIIRG